MPTGTSTVGAPAGRVSAKATQGLPAADSAAGVVSTEVLAVLAVVVVVTAAVLVESEPLLRNMSSPMPSRTANPVPTESTMRRRRS